MISRLESIEGLQGKPIEFIRISEVMRNGKPDIEFVITEAAKEYLQKMDTKKVRPILLMPVSTNH